MIKDIRYIGLSGQKRKVCTKICDECGKKETVRVDVVERSRRKSLREQVVDLCRSCSGTRKYKKLPRGRKNKNWKHGLHMSGYRLVRDAAGRKDFEHRFIYENYVGRKLDKEERIHHIDMDKLNNDINNLFLCQDRSHHGKIHSNMEKCGYELFREFIWFDVETKKYTLTPCDFLSNIPYNKEVVDKFSKFKLYKIVPKSRNIRPYYTISEKKNGTWTTRIYHTYFVSELLGRKLSADEAVHHLDGDALNNDINNLFLLTQSNHIKCHRFLQHCVAELYKMGVVEFDKNSFVHKYKKKKN